MGRPSKLSEKQWQDIDNKLRHGENAAKVAKEFKVSKSLLYDRLSGKVQKEKVMANKILAVEQEFKALPISGQVAVINFLDDLRVISTNMAGAARNGSLTALKLSAIASRQVDKIDEDDPMESQEVLQSISALTKISNDAGNIAMNLINSNKDRLIEPADEMNKNNIGVTLVLNRRG